MDAVTNGMRQQENYEEQLQTLSDTLSHLKLEDQERNTLISHRERTLKSDRALQDALQRQIEESSQLAHFRAGLLSSLIQMFGTWSVNLPIYLTPLATREVCWVKLFNAW